MKNVFHAVLAGLLVSACAGAPGSRSRMAVPSSAAQEQGRPQELRDGIATGSLEDAKLDRIRIADGIAEVAKGSYGNVHSLLVFRHGKLVSENYFPGEDQNNHQGSLGLVLHNRETLHDVRSITKSVVALAVLIAHSRGQIPDLDQPLFDYFPDYAVEHAKEGKAGITIRHALTMTAGFEWSEGRANADNARLSAAPDPLAFVLGRPLVSPPGTRFNYNGGLTELLAAVVERATGTGIVQFTSDNLLTPLGITTFEWAKRSNGKPDPDSGLRLRSRDMAKIGLLLANKGAWRGRQILPAELVEEAVKAHIDIPRTAEAAALGDRLGYGYQIWLPSFLIDGRRTDLIQLEGNGGQFVLIDRRADLMVVTTGGDYYRKDLQKWPEDIYPDIVEPARLDR